MDIGAVRFQAAGVVLDHAQLRYNPCDDVIFPSVIKASDCLANPLDAWYMYYAPHNAPGGICMAHAPELTGPWTEFAGNPLIGRTWHPHYSVSHVSSPHAIWMKDCGQLFLYYHGENTATRWAASTDGIRFEYGGTAVSTDDFPAMNATSYARVFEHRIAAKASRFIMLFSAAGGAAQGIYAGWSGNGRDWSFSPEPLIGHPPVPNAWFVCSPWFLRWDGQCYVVYHVDFSEARAEGPRTDIYLSEVSPDLGSARLVGTWCSADLFGHHNARVSDPCIVVDDGQLYLFLTIGERLRQTVALAIAKRA